jgi:pyruvate,orthophosphate dikinase
VFQIRFFTFLTVFMQVLVVGDQVLCEGDWLSLNGSTGDVILGKLPLSPPSLSADLEIFLSWVDEVKQIKVKNLH